LAATDREGTRAIRRGLRQASQREVPFTGATIAKRLGRISYAEAEEFCLALLRAQILAAGERNLKAIIVDELNVWAEQARATAPSADRGDDAEALSSRATRTERGVG